MRKIRYFKAPMTRIVSSIFLTTLQRLPEITIIGVRGGGGGGRGAAAPPPPQFSQKY